MGLSGDPAAAAPVCRCPDGSRRVRWRAIGHYHTAGAPGRGELDESQEINRPTVMRAIVETGCTGHVAHGFIPTWSDKLAALWHGVQV